MLALEGGGGGRRRGRGAHLLCDVELGTIGISESKLLRTRQRPPMDGMRGGERENQSQTPFVKAKCRNSQ